MWSRVLVVLSALLLGQTDSRAGGRPYAFAQGIDTLPENELELESWFGVFDGGDRARLWDWWLGPVGGVTDKLEAGFFGRFFQREVDDGTEALVLSSLRLQLSYALADKGTWPVDARVRLELVQPTEEDGAHEIWVSVILGKQLGRLDLTLNAGVWVELDTPDDGVVWWFNYALGASVDVAGGLRVGAEVYGDARFEDPDHNHYAGPAAAYGRGRFWVSGSWLFGLGSESRDLAARVVVGVLL